MVEGLDRLRRKLLALPKRAKTEMAAALRQSADEITALQRNLAPVEDGTLRSSIESTVSNEGLRVTISAGGPATTKPVREGADAEYDYALGIEFGTENMPAKPFFFPGYRAVRKRVKSRMSRAVNKAAKAVAGGG